MRSLFVLCAVPMAVQVASFVVVPPVRTVQSPRGDASVDGTPAAMSVVGEMCSKSMSGSDRGLEYF